MSMHICSIIVLVLTGCSDKDLEYESVSLAVRSALGGISPDENAKNLWKKMSNMKPEKFYENAHQAVEEMCFKKESDYHQCQKNTLIMKDVDWTVVQSNKEDHLKTFVQGVRIFMGDPKSPIPDDMESLREELRKAIAAKTKAENSLQAFNEDMYLLVDVDTDVLKAINADPVAVAKIKTLQPIILANSILRLLKDEKSGFNLIKAVPGYDSLFNGISFGDLSDQTRLNTLAESIQKKLIS